MRVIAGYDIRADISSWSDQLFVAVIEASQIATDAGMALKVSFFWALVMIPEKQRFSSGWLKAWCSGGRLKKNIKESQVSKKIKSLQK
ncbi:hypothetical protein ACSAZL_04825 [Methanosarcina sp. T3]|uniref:hypothetical protein n=1 Tax=Methanosarcina sp. T3 TaxID=3439062 RepID=UPI003F868FF0